MIFCFNELCVDFLNKNEYSEFQVNDANHRFLKILQRASVIDNKMPELRTEEGMWGMLVKGVPLKNWLLKNLDHDLRVLLMSINDRSPLLDLEQGNEVYFYQGNAAKGLSASVILDCSAISLSFSEGEENPITVLTTNTGEQKVTFNFTNPVQFNDYERFFMSVAHCKNYIHNLDQLKEKAREHQYWDRLMFSDKFYDIKLDYRLLDKLVYIFCTLNSFLHSVSMGEKRLHQLNSVIPDVRNESDTVRSDRKMRMERKVLFDGKEIFCFMHTGLDDSHRVYFQLDHNNDRYIGYIGYIGPHLSTKKYKGN